MEWEKLLSTENLQLVATICGAVIFTIYMSFQTFKKKLNEAMLERQTDVPKKIKSQSQLDCAVIEYAEKVKELLDADRVQIYEFHNGVHYANGRSALKMTCTYEVLRYGVSSSINIMSNVPLSIMPIFVRELLDKGSVMVENIEEIKNTMPPTYALSKSLNIKKFFAYVIYNGNNEPVGFVEVDYCRENAPVINKDVVKKFAWFVESKLLEMK